MDRIGRYTVLRELGHGGMGRVFHARDPELERSVALKLLHRENAEHADVRGLFRDEARALAALSHPGIVTIFEIGQHDGQQFIAMEYLPGRSLRQLLQFASLRRSRDELVAICGKVAIAVAAAHAAGILHRDIKPENVMVGDDGTVKVVDFGIAHRLDGEAGSLPHSDTDSARASVLVDAFSRTVQINGLGGATTVVTAATETIFGTPAYMAREVLMGDPSSEASDMYSLGVMLYECLSGRRPIEAPNLREVLARVIDGREPVAALDDPLWPLLARMLDPDPSVRPRLGELAGLLEPPDPVAPAPAPRGSRTGWLIAALVALVALGGVAAWRARGGPTAPAATQTAIVRIAVQEVAVRLTTYGSGPPAGHTFSTVLAMVLAELDGIRPIAPAQLLEESERPGEWEPTARRLRADYLLRGTIEQVADAVEARLELVELATGRVTAIEARVAAIGELSRLMADAAELVAAQIAPAARLDRSPDRARARVFYNAGYSALQKRDWSNARPYLEQAVEIDPRFAEAWSAVASVRGWTMADPALLETAVERAAELAPAGPRRQIWQGAAHYFRGDFGKAIAALSALEQTGAFVDDDQRELLYYLGEAHWHDGNHDDAVALFRRILDSEIRFKHAAIHLGEYALGRRDLATAEVMIGVQEFGKAPVDFAAGKYEALAASGSFPYNLHAQLVLDRPVLDEDPRSGQVTALLIARALETGATAVARRKLDELWSTVAAKPPTEGVLFEIVHVAEVLVCADLPDDVRRLLALQLQVPGARAVREHHRYEILAAPLLGAPRTFDRRGMTARNARLADAIEAELAGDRARAADLLAALVADPTSTWDYPERFALARNLHASGRITELEALCEDVARPAVFREAFLLVRKACRRFMADRTPTPLTGARRQAP